MGITGRYNFPGMQKAANFAINTALAATSWGSWLLASKIFAPAFNVALGLIDNWLLNHGLIIINIEANIIDGKIDQKALDNAMDSGIKRVMQGRDKITPAEGKAIDDEVRKAFDKDADLDAAPADGVSTISSASVRAGNNTPI